MNCGSSASLTEGLFELVGHFSIFDEFPFFISTVIIISCSSLIVVFFSIFMFLLCVSVFQISGASVEDTLVGEVILSVLTVTVNKPALYTCLASNRHSSGANTVKATAKVTVAGDAVLHFDFRLSSTISCTFSLFHRYALQNWDNMEDLHLLRFFFFNQTIRTPKYYFFFFFFFLFFIQDIPKTKLYRDTSVLIRSERM